MRLIIIAICVILISGCAARAVHEDPSKLGFIKVSEGTGSGLYGVFAGGAKYCMLEIYNVQDVVVDEVDYTDGTCTVNWTAPNGLRGRTPEEERLEDSGAPQRLHLKVPQ